MKNLLQNLTRKQLYLIIFCLFVIPVLIAIATYGKKQTTKSTTVQDPTTKSTIRTITGESETADPGTGQVAIVGLEYFLPKGITTYQVSSIKLAINKFPDAQKTKYISIDKTSITVPILPEQSEDGLGHFDFAIVSDSGAKVNAKAYYSGLATLGVKFYDTTGKQVFDSGLIDSTPVKSGD